MNTPLRSAVALLTLLAACASPSARNGAPDAAPDRASPPDAAEEDRDALAADAREVATPDAPDAPADAPNAPDALDASADTAPPCPTGMRCGGVCVDTSADLAHCGACDTRCTLAHGTPACAGGRCTVARCDAGHDRVGDACVVIPSPRLVFPLSGSAVTSRQPTLRWLDAAGTDGARVQLCRDRAMMTGCIARPALDASFRPGAPLDPGVYFWRAYGVVGATTGSTPSPTWEFYVGRGDPRRPAADTAARNFVDFDGDASSDVVFGRPGLAATSPGGFTVFAGGATAWAGSPPTGRAIAPPADADPKFGGTFAAGDFNGDGRSDLAVASSLGGAGSYVYFGGDTGIAASPAPLALPRPATHAGAFGWALSAIDADGDGFQDLLVGSVSVNGAVFVYRGSERGLTAPPSATITPPPDAPLLTAMVRAIGDVDGDGYGDAVVLTAPLESPPTRSALWLHRGSAAGLRAAGEAVTVPGVVVPNYLEGGDVDGDRMSDLIVGSRVGGGYLVVIAGHPTGTPAATATVRRGPMPTPGGFGASLVADFNGDGFSDVMADRAISDAQAYEVFSGGPTGLSNAPTSSVSASLIAGGPLVSLGATRDLDGDGFEEFALGMGTAATPGDVRIFSGGVNGLQPGPRWTLLGSSLGGAFGLGMLPAY